MFKAGTIESKVLAIAITLLIGVAIVEGIYFPLKAGFDERYFQIEQKSILLAKLRLYADKKDFYVKKLSELEPVDRNESKFISAGSLSQGNAFLQKNVKELILDNSGTIKSLRNIPVSKKDGVVTVGVNLDANITLEGIVKVLSEIEKAKPLLQVSSMVVRTKRQSNKNAKNITDKISMSVQMTIHSVMKDQVL
ncbi:type II secretion system protein GspM [Kiloniella litopenaei]|uniref:type II secretion system protein GspM n=1 Tax=Kiloniella litopenaei TaxID=1549748 RepID=UPI003BACB91F